MACMAIVVWLRCDHLVPDGVCGTNMYSVADTVADAVIEADADGWYVAAATGGRKRRVLCPTHAGRSGVPRRS